MMTRRKKAQEPATTKAGGERERLAKEVMKAVWTDFVRRMKAKGRTPFSTYRQWAAKPGVLEGSKVAVETVLLRHPSHREGGRVRWPKKRYLTGPLGTYEFGFSAGYNTCLAEFRRLNPRLIFGAGKKKGRAR